MRADFDADAATSSIFDLGFECSEELAAFTSSLECAFGLTTNTPTLIQDRCAALSLQTASYMFKPNQQPRKTALAQSGCVLAGFFDFPSIPVVSLPNSASRPWRVADEALGQGCLKQRA
jgi:hypothetical protein